MHYSPFTRAVITSGEFALPAKWRYCLSYERLIQAAFLDLVGRPLVGGIDLASHAGWENKALPDIKVHALGRYNAWVSRKAVPKSRALWGRLAIINAVLPHESPDSNVFGTGSRPGLCGALRWRGTNRWRLYKEGCAPRLPFATTVAAQYGLRCLRPPGPRGSMANREMAYGWREDGDLFAVSGACHEQGSARGGSGRPLSAAGRGPMHPAPIAGFLRGGSVRLLPGAKAYD